MNSESWGIDLLFVLTEITGTIPPKYPIIERNRIIRPNSTRYGADNLADFKIMDAMAGERAYKKQMRDAMAAYLKFRSKIEAYFSIQLKKK